MTIWFSYSFQCPICGEIVTSGKDLLTTESRDQIPALVLGRHDTCPKCGQSFPPGERITLSITESS
jgi:predicted RNA-binding Zn-ribbon protein involved in translation (DUF1610 family)